MEKLDVNNLTSTLEDYLEAIYALAKDNNNVVRVNQIATKLNVKSPTVNSALKYLAENNLVIHEKYGYVTLTKKGAKIALEVQKKHEILFRFLTEFLMLDNDAADKEACEIEHSISKETFMKLNKFFEFLEIGLNGDEKPKILQQFADFLKSS